MQRPGTLLKKNFLYNEKKISSQWKYFFAIIKIKKDVSKLKYSKGF